MRATTSPSRRACCEPVQCEKRSMRIGCRRPADPPPRVVPIKALATPSAATRAIDILKRKQGAIGKELRPEKPSDWYYLVPLYWWDTPLRDQKKHGLAMKFPVDARPLRVRRQVRRFSRNAVPDAGFPRRCVLHPAVSLCRATVCCLAMLSMAVAVIWQPSTPRCRRRRSDRRLHSCPRQGAHAVRCALSRSVAANVLSRAYRHRHSIASAYVGPSARVPSPSGRSSGARASMPTNQRQRTPVARPLSLDSDTDTPRAGTRLAMSSRQLDRLHYSVVLVPPSQLSLAGAPIPISDLCNATSAEAEGECFTPRCVLAGAAARVCVPTCDLSARARCRRLRPRPSRHACVDSNPGMSPERDVRAKNTDRQPTLSPPIGAVAVWSYV